MPEANAQKRRLPPGGNIAVVVDERLAALRNAPELSARLVRRLNHGRFVSVRGAGQSREGVAFYHVAVSRRTTGWLQRDAIVASWRTGDDDRLLRLIESSEEFERLARARIFLETFPHSPLRPRVLLLYGDAAEEVALKLSRDAQRRFAKSELPAHGAPEFSYFLNFSALDRYNRQGATFTFDRARKQFHYDGATWREILRHHYGNPEAAEARKRLAALATVIAGK